VYFSITSSEFKLLSYLTFFAMFVHPVFFKIVIQICEIISYIPILFSNKTNYDKIYGFIKKLNKKQTFLKKQQQFKYR
jgi:hypothetical protein